MKKKKYKSVEEMVCDLGDKKFKKSYIDDIAQTRLSMFLFSLRCKNLLTYRQMAKKLNCSKTKINRLESTHDKNFKLKDMIAYARAFDLKLKICFESGDKSEIIEL